MAFYLGLLLAGLLQGVMVSFNGQLGKYYSLFGITLFVHGIALVLLLAIVSLAVQRIVRKKNRAKSPKSAKPSKK